MACMATAPFLPNQFCNGVRHRPATVKSGPRCAKNDRVAPPGQDRATPCIWRTSQGPLAGQYRSLACPVASMRARGVSSNAKGGNTRLASSGANRPPKSGCPHHHRLAVSSSWRRNETEPQKAVQPPPDLPYLESFTTLSTVEKNASLRAHGVCSPCELQNPAILPTNYVVFLISVLGPPRVGRRRRSSGCPREFFPEQWSLPLSIGTGSSPHPRPRQHHQSLLLLLRRLLHFRDS